MSCISLRILVPTPRLEREHGVSQSHPGDVTVARPGLRECGGGRGGALDSFCSGSKPNGEADPLLKIPIKPQHLVS